MNSIFYNVIFLTNKIIVLYFEFLRVEIIYIYMYNILLIIYIQLM